MSNWIGILPIKEHSARVPRKNFRELGGRPLFTHTLQTLLSLPELSKVVVSTDSKLLLEELRANWPQVTPLERPKVLAMPETPMNKVIQHVLENFDADFCIQTHTTSPFLRSETIQSAIDRFQSEWPESDSLFSVTAVRERIWGSDTSPINHETMNLVPTQALDPLYIENSGFYIFNRREFLNSGNRIGQKPIMFETSLIESIDIDTKEQFAFAEVVWRGSFMGGAE